MDTGVMCAQGLQALSANDLCGIIVSSLVEAGVCG